MNLVLNFLSSFPLGAITDQREITIQKYSLSPGIYIVQLNIALQNLGYSDSDEKYLEIAPIPLNVKIKGGAARLLSWERDILLDGSLSYDPNILSGNQKNLRYKWYCKVKPGALYFTIGKGGCFGYGDGIIENNYVTWRIPAKLLIRNAIYIITLVAESLQVPGRTARFEQHIDVRSGTVMKTSIV